jgi:dihydromonapterin reductase / dihydrofolate reductase
MNPNRTLLITGVSRRIGAHLAAHHLAQGDRIIGMYRQRTEEIDTLEDQGMLAFAGDLTNPDDIASLVNFITNHTQHLDAVIHNASVWYSDADCNRTPARIHELYQIHVTAPVILSEQLQSALPARSIDGQAGRLIVFITDARCQQGKSDHLHYMASKAAAESAARSLALKFAPHTRVNTIAPGLILFQPKDSTDKRAARLVKNLLPFEPGSEAIAQTLDYLLACPSVDATRLTVDCGYSAGSA